MNYSRNYRIDLLRAISMLLIVVQHYVVWGVKYSPHASFDTSTLAGGGNFILMELLYLTSCIGVNCFVMISGYYLIDKKCFRWQSLMNLWVTTMFYSVILYLVTARLTGNFNLRELINCFLPIWSRQYWFISTYMAVMLLAPFFAMLATKLSKKSYQVMLVILFILSFMVPYGSQFAGGQSVMWMSFVFLLAGYIRLHGFFKPIINNAGKTAILLCLAYALIFYATDAIKLNHVFGTGFLLHAFASDSPIFFLSLVMFLLTIRNKNSSDNSWVRYSVTIAPNILAVYLIHMNRNFYPFIWEVFIPKTYCIPMALHAVLVSSIIFLLCIVIDYTRIRLFQVIGVSSCIERLSNKLKILIIE